MRSKFFVTSMSRCMVEHIKFYANSKIPEFRDFYKDLLVIVKVVGRSEEESETGVVAACYDSLGQIVRVDLIVPFDIAGHWFSKFIPSFKRSLRHEIEHYSQHVRGGLDGEVLLPFLTMEGSLNGTPQKGPWSTIAGAVRYFLNHLEVEAHVVGIQAEALARRIQFHVVLKEIISKIGSNLRESGLRETHITFLSRRLYQVWGFYALARYPSLRRNRRKVRVLVEKEFDFPIDE